MDVVRKERHAALIITLLIICNAAMPQSSSFSLKSLIDSSATHLPLLLERQAEANSYKAAVTDVKHLFLPQIRLNDQINIGTDNSIAGGYLPLGTNISVSSGVRGKNDYQPVTGNVAVLYSEYELADFGLKSARINNALANADVAEANFQSAIYEVKHQIAQLYFGLVKDEYKLKADSENIKRYESIFKVISALSASGIRPGADSSLSKAELSKAIITFNQTLGDFYSLRQQLSYLSGINAEKIEADTSVIHFVGSLPEYDMMADKVNHPLIEYYLKQKRMFLSNEQLIKKSYLPKILIAGASWARGSSIEYADNFKSVSNGIDFQRFNYMAGIAVTYDVFNSVHKKDKLAISRFQTEASDFALKQEQSLLINAALQANNALLTVKSNLKELPVQMQSANDVYLQKMAQYKAGLINLIDLTNASFVLYRSQTDYIETLGDWYLATLDRAAATGNLDSFIQSIK